MSSCGPSRHAISVEMRYPSKSGLELSGKLISVIYLKTDDRESNVINENIAAEFAAALEDSYGPVGLFSVNGKKGEYAQKDSLINLLIQSGADLTFLFDEPEIGIKMSSGLPVKIILHSFDGMNKEEKILSFSSNKLLPATEKEMISEASKTGKLLADSFVPDWRHEQYSIAYYNSPKWYEALLRAEAYDWKGAMDIWFEFLDSNDIMKKAVAEYNIAVACYMMGDFELAEQWLDMSDKDNKLPTLSDGLRSRISVFLNRVAG